MSTPPNVSSAWVRIRSTVALSAASPITTSERAPRPSASLATASASASLLRVLTMTLAPQRANSSTIARPIFRPEPVTSAVLPAIPKSSLTFDSLRPHLPGLASRHSEETSNCPSRIRCRHLLKTFWGGVKGWRDEQHCGRTLIPTSPSGHTYVTTPGSALLFPSLCLSNGAIPAPEADPPPDTDEEPLPC